VKAIADGDAAQGIKGLDPVLTGQLSREEIEKAVADPDYRLKLLDPKVRLPEAKKKKGPRYTPVSRRQDRRMPSSGWCATIPSSRTARSCDSSHHQVDHPGDPRTHPLERFQPAAMDPVTLGLCSQIDLDLEVHRAAKEKPVDVEAQGATLLPASETTIRREPSPKRRSRPTNSTSTPYSPSSSRSAARPNSDLSAAAPPAIQAVTAAAGDEDEDEAADDRNVLGELDRLRAALRALKHPKRWEISVATITKMIISTAA